MSMNRRLEELLTEYTSLWEAIDEAGDNNPMTEAEMDARNNMCCWLEDNGEEFNFLRVKVGLDPVRYLK